MAGSGRDLLRTRKVGVSEVTSEVEAWEGRLGLRGAERSATERRRGVLGRRVRVAGRAKGC